MRRDRLLDGEFNWAVGTFIIGYHLALLVGLPFYFVYAPPSLALVVASVVLLLLTEIGVGAAYHRFYSHRCYALRRPAEVVLLFLATLATQGSALRWSYEHRLHHAFTDTDADPHSFAKGFWYAHLLWLFEKSKPMDEKRVRDLLANPLVRFQHRYAHALSIGSNFVVCGVLGWLVGDYLGAFVLAWWTRLAVSHHLTWAVNSVAHCWGARTYSRELSAVDNYLLAILTVGEGYHNYHHTFPGDYRNGVRWYHVDPTKWTVWTLSKLGLARGLKRVSRQRIQTRLLREDRSLLLDRLRQAVHARGTQLERHVEDLAERILRRLHRQRALIQEMRRLRSTRAESRGGRRAARRSVRRELAVVRHALRADWRAWHRLCRTVLDLPATA